MIPRERHVRSLEELLDRHPVVAILGARQVGKTTLARSLMDRLGKPVTHFDLEDPDDLARLDEPKLALAGLEGPVVIDEIQRRPDLFPVLRVLVERPAGRARFLLLGSASPGLLRQGSETLAGRIIYHELGGFTLEEVGIERRAALWLRGGFPLSFLERDLPQIGITIPSRTLHRFWTMLAHYHGQIWNGAELARAFGVATTTVRRYLDLLIGSLVVRQLLPWHANLNKRQVRSSKVYIADCGILHTLMGIEDREALERHPKVGASWEGFVLHEVLERLGARAQESYFWATHSGAELDLLIVRGRYRIGFEIKRTTRPKATRSMYSARDALALQRLVVIHAGEHSFALAKGIDAVAFERIFEDLEPLDDA